MSVYLVTYVSSRIDFRYHVLAKSDVDARDKALQSIYRNVEWFEDSINKANNYKIKVIKMIFSISKT